MSESRKKIVSEHHFALESGSPSFVLDGSRLMPYSTSQGNWHVRVAFLASSKNLKGEGDFSSGLKLTSVNIVTANSACLVLWTASQKAFKEGGNLSIVHRARSHKITLASDTLYFRLSTLDDREVEIEAAGKFLLGLELLQMA